jgi:hypothetical protein
MSYTVTKTYIVPIGEFQYQSPAMITKLNSYIANNQLNTSSLVRTPYPADPSKELVTVTTIFIDQATFNEYFQWWQDNEKTNETAYNTAKGIAIQYADPAQNIIGVKNETTTVLTQQQPISSDWVHILSTPSTPTPTPTPTPVSATSIVITNTTFINGNRYDFVCEKDSTPYTVSFIATGNGINDAQTLVTNFNAAVTNVNSAVTIAVNNDNTVTITDNVGPQVYFADGTGSPLGTLFVNAGNARWHYQNDSTAGAYILSISNN